MCGGAGTATTGAGTRRRQRCGWRVPLFLRLRHPCRNPELAHRQVLVALEQHARRREQGVALAPGVLDEVLLELADERPLVRGELLPVGG